MDTITSGQIQRSNPRSNRLRARREVRSAERIVAFCPGSDTDWARSGALLQEISESTSKDRRVYHIDPKAHKGFEVVAT
jgi:hypothetical protein